MTPFFTIDSSLPNAAKINAFLEADQKATFASIYRGQIEALGGSELSGQILPGTTLKYEDTTEVQSYIYQGYSEAGEVIPENIQSILDSNRGPDKFWNWPPENGGFGLNGTAPNAQFKPELVVIVGTAAEVSGIVLSKLS